MDINKIFLLGRLGSDPNLTENDGRVMVRFTLATNENYLDHDGNSKELIEWHKVVAFGKRAQACERFLKKGSSVHIEGRNATRSYKKDDNTHYITEVQIKEIQFLDTKG